MTSQLECIYKGIREIKAGEFINTNGEKIKYNEYYKLRFDQIINGLPKETEIKIKKELALNVVKNFNIYDKIVITFNILFYNNNRVIIEVKDIKKI